MPIRQFEGNPHLLVLFKVAYHLLKEIPRGWCYPTNLTPLCSEVTCSIFYILYVVENELQVLIVQKNKENGLILDLFPLHPSATQDGILSEVKRLEVPAVSMMLYYE